MDSLWFEIVVIGLLILANGFFAGAELAIVSVRRSRIAHLAAGGDRRARLVEQLQADPHRFLATVQIGVTLVGTMASAVGGATAIEFLKPLLQQSSLPVVREGAEPLALFVVVSLIAYGSLVIGELVPKAVALQHAERVALQVALPISWLARVGGVAVATLTRSSQAVLAILGIRRTGANAFITREEIEHVVAEGRESGEVTPGEQNLIRNIFDFTQTQVREVMIPRTRVVAIDLAAPQEEILGIVLENRFSRYPAYRGERENLVGFINAKDILGTAVTDPERSFNHLVQPPVFVPEAKKIDVLLQEMQHRRLRMVLVVDEFGSVSGIVTTEDLLEELVGEIEDEHDVGRPRRIKRLEGGACLVDALLSLNDLENLLGIDIADDLPCDTLAGLILHLLGRFPSVGEQLAWQEYLLTCVEVTPTAIVRVKIEKRDGERVEKRG